jgi:hypothetical protein
MTRVAALLLQLTLWVATAHAFFPFVPKGHCAPDEDECGPAKVGGRKTNDGSDQTSEGLTVDLYHKPTRVCCPGRSACPVPKSGIMVYRMPMLTPLIAP